MPFPPPPPPVNFRMQVPPELEGGDYANMAAIWHTAYEFTLDFAVMQPLEQPQEDGEPPTLPCRVTSRVKLPVTALFDLLQAINANLSIYEQNFGEIQRPQQQGGEP